MATKTTNKAKPKQVQPKPKAETPKAEVKEIRKTFEKQVEQKQVLTSSIDYMTLKRMYPKRFLNEILQTEGYVKDGIKYKKI